MIVIIINPLETFLAKYSNCAKYNCWSDEECGVFLRDSLTGNASQVLWETSSDASADGIIRLLKNRFGNSNQMERYRAELHSRRRMKGESVQAVYQDIRRLLALGFPGESGDLFETIGRDAFLTALADPALRIRVLDQHPRTLDDALAVVVRMEAYGPNSVSDDDNVERKRVRVVSPVRESEADRRIRELEKRVECQNKEIQRLKQTTNRGNDRPQQQSNTGSRAVWGNRGSNGGPDVVPHGGADGGFSTAREGGPCAARDATYIPHDSGPVAVRNGGPNGGPGHAPGFLGNHPVASGVGPQAGWHPANLYYADSQYTAAPANTPSWQQQRQWTRRPPVPV